MIAFAIILAWASGFAIAYAIFHRRPTWNPNICDGCGHHKSYHYQTTGSCHKGLFGCSCWLFVQPAQPPEPPPDVSWVKDLFPQQKKDK